MKIFASLLFLSSALFAQPAPEGALPPAGSSAGGYNTTIYNKNYSRAFVGKDANPTEELEVMYPQSSYTMEQKQDGSGVDNRSTGPDFTGAKAQAIYWLGLLDQKAYGSSWSQAGGLLQDIIGQNIWVAAMQAVRGSLGNNTGRTVAGHNTLSRLPHGTTGRFTEITFNSSFSSQARAKERVILMASGDRGHWKVIAYSIEK